MLPSVTEHLQAIVDSVRDPDSGELADYIDVLKHADPDKLALAMCTTDGHLYAVGDADYEFSIQSISKPFVYALALDMYGPEEVHAHVGVEPSGEAFNKLSLDDDGRPANPLINAGAITVNQLIGGPDIPVEQRSEKLRDYFSRLAGRELTVDERVLDSELDAADRNKAFAHMLREAGTISDDAHDAVASYIAQCAVLVTVKDLAVMAAIPASALGGAYLHAVGFLPLIAGGFARAAVGAGVLAATDAPFGHGRGCGGGVMRAGHASHRGADRVVAAGWAGPRGGVHRRVPQRDSGAGGGGRGILRGNFGVLPGESEVWWRLVQLPRCGLDLLRGVGGE